MVDIQLCWRLYSVRHPHIVFHLSRMNSLDMLSLRWLLTSDWWDYSYGITYRYHLRVHKDQFHNYDNVSTIAEPLPPIPCPIPIWSYWRLSKQLHTDYACHYDHLVFPPWNPDRCQWDQCNHNVHPQNEAKDGEDITNRSNIFSIREDDDDDTNLGTQCVIFLTALHITIVLYFVIQKDWCKMFLC